MSDRAGMSRTGRARNDPARRHNCVGSEANAHTDCPVLRVGAAAGNRRRGNMYVRYTERSVP